MFLLWIFTTVFYYGFTTNQRIYIYLSWKHSVYDTECFYYGFLLRFFTTDLLRMNAFYIYLSWKRSVYDMECFYYGFLLRFFTTDQRIYIYLSWKRSVYDTECFYYGFLLRFLLRIYYGSTHLHMPFLETLGRSFYARSVFLRAWTLSLQRNGQLQLVRRFRDGVRFDPVFRSRS